MRHTQALAPIPVDAWDACRRCHDQCVSACPVFRVTGDTRYYPSRLAQAALELVHRAQTTWPSHALDLFFTGCVLCGLCEAQCVYLSQPKNAYDMVLTMRERLAGAYDVRSIYHDVRRALLLERDVDEGFSDLLSQVTDARVVSAEGGAGSVTFAPEGEEVLVLVDPYSAAWMTGGVAALIKLLQASGKRVAVADRPVELGGTLWQAGLAREAGREFQLWKKALQELGFAAIVTTLPSDVWYWSRGADKSGLRVMTAVEALAWARAEGERSGPDQAESIVRVAVQDSSVISRCLKQRKVVESLLAGKAAIIPEPGMVGEERTAQPVAYEGVPVLLSEDVHEGIVASRLAQLEAMDPEQVITMDPFSHKALSGRAIGGRRVPVKTLFEFLWEQGFS